MLDGPGFSFSPRYKKLFSRIANGKVESKDIAISLDTASKKNYTISFELKDEFGDPVSTKTLLIVPSEVKTMRQRLVDEYKAVTDEYDSNIAILDSIIDILKE